MQNRQKVMTVLGLLLGAFGLALLNFGNAPMTSTAAEETYSSTWNAKKILAVGALVGSGNTFTFWAGIGVWGWEVNGQFGTTTYSETWTAPSINGVSFTVTNEGCSPKNIDPLKILAGCFGSQGAIGGPNTNTDLFEIKDVNDPALIGHQRTVNASNTPQRTISCIESPRSNNGETECIFQTGSYSFQHVLEIGSNTRMRWLGGGTLTPLEWHVEGTIVTP